MVMEGTWHRASDRTCLHVSFLFGKEQAEYAHVSHEDYTQSKTVTNSSKIPRPYTLSEFSLW